MTGSIRGPGRQLGWRMKAHAMSLEVVAAMEYSPGAEHAQGRDRRDHRQ